MNKKINKHLSLGTTTDGDLTLTIKTLQRHYAPLLATEIDDFVL